MEMAARLDNIINSVYAPNIMEDNATCPFESLLPQFVEILQNHAELQQAFLERVEEILHSISTRVKGPSDLYLPPLEVSYEYLNTLQCIEHVNRIHKEHSYSLHHKRNGQMDDGNALEKLEMSEQHCCHDCGCNCGPTLFDLQDLVREYICDQMAFMKSMETKLQSELKSFLTYETTDESAIQPRQSLENLQQLEEIVSRDEDNYYQVVDLLAQQIGTSLGAEAVTRVMESVITDKEAGGVVWDSNNNSGRDAGSKVQMDIHFSTVMSTIIEALVVGTHGSESEEKLLLRCKKWLSLKRTTLSV